MVLFEFVSKNQNDLGIDTLFKLEKLKICLKKVRFTQRGKKEISKTIYSLSHFLKVAFLQDIFFFHTIALRCHRGEYYLFIQIEIPYKIFAQDLDSQR